MKKQLFLNLGLVLLFGFFTSCGETNPKKTSPTNRLPQ